MTRPASIKFWWFRLGRLALASPSRGPVGGWRRLWWCFWWDLRIPLPEPIVTEAPPASFLTSAEKARPIHLLLGNDSYMACGLAATSAKGLRWTTIWSQTTCPACRQLGASLHDRYWVTTR